MKVSCSFFVATMGDGVNDVPASMVLTDDNFATIIETVENGQNIYK